MRYALRERAMSDSGALDKRRRGPGTGLTPDKKEARSNCGTRSDASAALAALAGGPQLQLQYRICNRAASKGEDISSPTSSSARATSEII